MLNHDQHFLQMLNKMNGTNYIGTIKFDLDDVSALFAKRFIERYNDIYQDQLTTEHMIDWDLSSFVKPEAREHIYNLLKEPGLFRSLEPDPHAQEVIQRLTDNGFEIIVVSDSPPGHSFTDYKENSSFTSNPADDKRSWLREYFPMIPQSKVIFTSEKYRIRGDVLVDDKPETFLIHEQLGMEVILVDRPCNRFIDTPKRAHTLLEVEQKIYQLFNI